MKKSKIMRTLILIAALFSSSHTYPNAMVGGYLLYSTACQMQQAFRFCLCKAASVANADCHQIWEEPDNVACVNTPYYLIATCVAIGVFACLFGGDHTTNHSGKNGFRAHQ